MAEKILVDAKEVTKIYKTGEIETHALRGVNLEVAHGEFIAIVGPSGSGKTTLLNLIGALDVVTGGQLTVLGKDVSKLSKHKRADLRLHSIGFVFQAYNLVPVLTAQENVEFVLELQGVVDKRSQRATDILEELGLAEYADRRPRQLSGGQQQRVAVARAIVSEPDLVLADEPTANLDSVTAKNLMQLFVELNQQHSTTFVISTHDTMVMSYARRLIKLHDGRIVDDIDQTQG